MQNPVVLYNESLTLGEKFSTGITTLLVGMAVVFSVLLIIMLVISLIGKIFSIKDQKAAKKATAKAEATPAAPEPEALPVTEEAGNEEEIVAAITAAIAVVTEAPVGSFRVVSFRKTTAKAAWNKK